MPSTGRKEVIGTTATDFVYASLDTSKKQIRVIRLVGWTDHSCEGARILACEIKTVDLVSKPEFHALSYTWGDAKSRTWISLNGKRFSITTSLYTFLLQHEKSERRDYWLWIDQICINQLDVLERNRQVSQMAEVYQGSLMGLIWLGEGTPKTDQALEVLSTYEIPEQPVLPLLNDEIARHMFKIWRLPYWSRLWIIQEAHLLSDAWIMCGARSMSLKQMRALLPSLVRYCDYQKIMADGATAASSAFEARAVEALSDLIQGKYVGEYFDILPSISRAGCSDVRDRIFGVQAIIDQHYTVEVDYDATAAQVCLDVVRAGLRGIASPRSVRIRDYARILSGRTADRVDLWGTTEPYRNYAAYIGVLMQCLGLDRSFTLRALVCREIYKSDHAKWEPWWSR